MRTKNLILTSIEFGLNHELITTWSQKEREGLDGTFSLGYSSRPNWSEYCNGKLETHPVATHNRLEYLVLCSFHFGKAE